MSRAYEEKKHLYPKEWKWLVAFVRYRSGGRCECGGAYNTKEADMTKRFSDRVYGDIEARVLARGKFSDYCWIWTGCLSTGGYGRVRIDGVTQYVHRMIVEWCIGRKLKTSEQIDHRCRNRRCFRPSHLEVVTARENVQRGSVTKLSAEQVVEIQRLRRKGFGVQELAKIFHIHHSHVSRVARGLRNPKKYEAPYDIPAIKRTPARPGTRSGQ